MVIDNFHDGEHDFLSNFWVCTVVFEGFQYTNSEAAYQASKTFDLNERQKFQTMGPGLSKKMGRKLVIRPDWENVKLTVMYQIIKAKFEQNLLLAKKLVATGDAELIEGNTWNDVYWGVCKGVGENHLGKILMQVRKELKVRTINDYLLGLLKAQEILKSRASYYYDINSDNMSTETFTQIMDVILVDINAAIERCKRGEHPDSNSVAM